MPLLAQHRIVLERYRSYRDRPPTMWRLMALSIIHHAAMVMMSGAAFAIALAIDMSDFSWFFAGALVGAFARDLGLFRRMQQAWPAMLTVIDWNKVDQALAGEIEIQKPDPRC